MSLKSLFIRRILPPLLLSILFTAFLSTSCIIIYNKLTLSLASDLLISDEVNFVQSMGESTKTIITENFLKMIDNLEAIKNYISILENSPASIESPAKSCQNANLINGNNLAMGKVNVTQLSGYDSRSKVTFDYGIWFLNPNITEYDQLSNISKRNFELIDQVDFFLKSTFLTTKASLQNIYLFFESDGLQYMYPAFENPSYIKFKTNESCEYSESGRMEYFDMRCRPYAKEMKRNLKSSFLKRFNLISEPYFYFQNQLFSLTMCNYDVYQEKISINNLEKEVGSQAYEERRLKYAICLDFDLKLLHQMFEGFYNVDKAHFFMIKSDLTVFYHPVFKELMSMNADLLNSITEYEYKINDEKQDQDALQFNTSLRIALQNMKKPSESNTEQITTFNFTKNGKEYISVLNEIGISTSGEDLSTGKNVLYLILVRPKFLILQTIEKSQSAINSFVISQIVIFAVIIILLLLVSHFLILHTVKSLITPLNDLSEGVKKIVNDDLESDFNKEYQPSSEEFNTLYKSFCTLKNLMKYANEAFFSGNDAEALIKYSNALKLYKDLDHKSAVGIIANNIGNIHLKNNRLEEALDFYKLSVLHAETEVDKLRKENSFRKTFLRPQQDTIIEAFPPSNEKVYFTVSRRTRGLENESNIQINKSERLETSYQLLANRTYQYAITLLDYCEKKGEKKMLEEVKDLFIKVIHIDSKTLQKNHDRVIKCLIFVAACYLEASDFVGSLKYLHDAEETIKNYLKFERKMDSLGLDEKKKGSEEFLKLKNQFPTKSDILIQLLLFNYGNLYKKMGKYKNAGYLFTRSLEQGKYYDPDIRNKALVALNKIFSTQGLSGKAPNIRKILEEGDEINDVIFLLDYSESMDGPRIKYAIRCILNIFDNFLNVNDRISLIRFNSIIEIIFPFTLISSNSLQLRIHIQTSLQPSGPTCLYHAILFAIHQFSMEKKRENENNNGEMEIKDETIQNLKQKRRSWLICLTDGGVTSVTSNGFHNQKKMRCPPNEEAFSKSSNEEVPKNMMHNANEARQDDNTTTANTAKPFEKSNDVPPPPPFNKKYSKKASTRMTFPILEKIDESQLPHNPLSPFDKLKKNLSNSEMKVETALFPYNDVEIQKKKLQKVLKEWDGRVMIVGLGAGGRNLENLREICSWGRGVLLENAGKEEETGQAFSLIGRRRFNKEVYVETLN